MVIPTYNEAGNVAEVLAGLRAGAPGVDALVVDDNSPDGTAGIAEAVGAEHGGVTVLRRPAKQGLGRAYLSGFAWALGHGYDAVVEMDADLSHDPAQVPTLLAALAHAELVIGSRYVAGGSIPTWSRRRRLLSRWGNRYSTWMLGLDIEDLTSGFRAYRAGLLASLPLEGVRAGGYGFQIEMAYRAAAAGARIVEVPIHFVDRTDGRSKMSGAIMLEALGLVSGWGLRRRMGLPPRFAPAPGAGGAPEPFPPGR